jgi:hypothetical protein
MKITEGLLRLIGVMALFLMATADAAPSLELGNVKVEAAARTLSLPAKVNMRSGAIEYLVVHESGKIHESIFKTAVSPRELHAAALLFSGAGTNRPALKLKGIEVRWTERGESKRSSAAALIFDKAKKRPLKETKWAYRGSRLVDRVFLAEREGSIVAVREDRDALIDQDTPDAADDENWEPVTEALPALESAVTIVFQFE